MASRYMLAPCSRCPRWPAAAAMPSQAVCEPENGADSLPLGECEQSRKGPKGSSVFYMNFYDGDDDDDDDLITEWWDQEELSDDDDYYIAAALLTDIEHKRTKRKRRGSVPGREIIYRDRFWDTETLWYIMTACVIMHNMIIDNERDEDVDYDYDQEDSEVLRKEEYQRRNKPMLEKFLKIHKEIEDH
ncbi:Os02g0676600 [Oryza sativa Japonica Group]|uniref:Os02g0676600 protein n=1 Tax=Oryza sativa subsp. japonica TaxID=39947 RepID=Q0DYP8_ORYSJ|nr:Os02g0676600 [Oryza sativa Japonica Group]|eukprot:NP_001047726.2 Os02g0676600 [Oryza sativa Japonica Group]